MKRSKKYEEAAKLIDSSKTYTIAEAVDLVKKTNCAKFDASVEIHFQLGINPKKGEQMVRGTLTLPHGNGKDVKILAFTAEKAAEAKAAGATEAGGQELIDEIKKTGKCDYDVVIAEPAMMKNLAPLARTLGPKGLMPSPKNETITSNMEATIAELKKGKISYKNDDTANLHMMIGKVSFDNKQLEENITETIAVINKAKPSSSKGAYMKGIVLASTMGPGIRVSA